MTVSIPIDLSIDPVEIVLGACQSFTARCSVFIRSVGGTDMIVELTPHESDCGDLAGEFSNALLDAHERARIVGETRAMRERLVALALCETNQRDRGEKQD